MNYALDALWWRLRQPAVRDLAMLLTAPAPWLSGVELPVRRLLGEQGFRFLLALDDAPDALLDYLTPLAPFGHRLGLYAECLLAFWFAHAPHSHLLAHNLVINDADQGTTLGAADFVVLLNQQPVHIELACKYYGGDGLNVAAFCGFNLADTLEGKADKLIGQLALSERPEFAVAMAKLGVQQPVLRASIVRGMLFTPQAMPKHGMINPLAWHGVCADDWAVLLADYSTQTQLRAARIPRMQWLAPQRLVMEETVSLQELNHIDAGLVALMQQRPDGLWHEIARLMKRNP